MRAWGITPGSAGMVAQVEALASALGISVEMKKAQLHPLLAWLPNCFLLPIRGALSHFFIGDTLTAPWPQIVISCGRRGAAVALAIKAKSPATKVIHIQDPHISARYFDAVVAMDHDKISGPNVIKTSFALHSVTPEKLAAARAKFATKFTRFHPPHVAVLLGGSTNKYTLTGYAMEQLIISLKRFLESASVSLFITPSRRTGVKNIAMLRAAFEKFDRVSLYDFKDENPYMGMLALADAIIVTNDSVNMMSEAHATGKPFYILPLPGHKNTKPARFAEGLITDGIARPLGDYLEKWNYPPDIEMARVSEEIKRLIHL